VSRRVVINLVWFMVVFGVLMVWAVSNIVTIDRLERPYEITGDFEAASGVLPNAEVAFLGVHYGRVSDVERTPDGVRITMKIDRGKEIPKVSVARIFRKSAIGEPYIDFQTPPDFSDEGEFFRKGDEVPRDQTRIPLEFSELLRSASNVIGGIDPGQAGTLIHELALALDGRSGSLRDLAIAADELAATFAAKTDVLDRLATNNTRLTSVLAEHRGALGQSLGNLRLLAETLRAADGDVNVLLTRGTALLGTVADLVGASKGDLDCLLEGLVPIIETSGTAQRLEDLDLVLGRAAGAFANVWATRDEEADGVWVRVNLLLKTESPATQYNPPHPLPVPAAIPDCAPSIAPSAAAPFVPSAALRSATTTRTGVGPLPATGGAAALGAAGMLVLAAGLLRRLNRERHADD
jgi:phospholipid/cholesterol/gamma-HCH transport system substrate-binding protein